MTRPELANLRTRILAWFTREGSGQYTTAGALAEHLNVTDQTANPPLHPDDVRECLEKLVSEGLLEGHAYASVHGPRVYRERAPATPTAKDVH